VRRYWSDQDLIEGQEVRLSEEQFHHICGVCRQELGSRFELLCKNQKAYFVEIVSCNKKEAQIRVLESRTLKTLKKPYVKLCVSIPKFSTFETILEKSVELGVHSVYPFFSDFSFVRNFDKISDSRQERWNKIIKNASQQTGRSPLMGLDTPKKLKELLSAFNPNQNMRGLFLYEGESALTLRSALSNLHATPNSLEEIWIFIGSEGGFSSQEVQLFQSVNLQPVSLGEQVLRVETACLAAVSIIKYDLDIF
jgi:16S rRNA (uracil1498-N3)-methyltransferase